MAFKDLYKEKLIYCDIVLADLNPYNPEIKVCNGYDFYSSLSYKELISKNKHLPFFDEIKAAYPYFTRKQIGTLIRWLYRGLTLDQAINKVKSDYYKAKSFIKYRKNI